MLFSVIIPTFNRAALLRETLDSVFAQSFSDYEVIVVDDGSTDGTADYLRSLGEKIRVLVQPNRGAGAARNFGAAASKGVYLAFLDSDDLWFTWTLETYRKIAQQHVSPSFVTGNPLVFAGSDKIGKSNYEEISVETFADYYASSDQWRWFSASSFVIRRDVFTSVGGFPEQWGAEDAHLAMKLGCSSGFVHIRRPCTFAYRDQVNSLKTTPTYSANGAKGLLFAERAREFPGGTARARERWTILTRHLRPASLGCLGRGRLGDAWEIYCATFRWHVSLGRWKYLLGFPIKALLPRK